MIAFLFLSQNTQRSKRLDSLIEDTGNIHACGSGFSDTCVLLSVEVQQNIFFFDCATRFSSVFRFGCEH